MLLEYMGKYSSQPCLMMQWSNAGRGMVPSPDRGPCSQHSPSGRAGHLTSWLTMMLSFPPELSKLLFQLSAFTLAAWPFSALTCLLRLTSQIWTCSTHVKHSE